jgi:hypothetical protein
MDGSWQKPLGAVSGQPPSTAASVDDGSGAHAPRARSVRERRRVGMGVIIVYDACAVSVIPNRTRIYSVGSV